MNVTIDKLLAIIQIFWFVYLYIDCKFISKNKKMKDISIIYIFWPFFIFLIIDIIEKYGKNPYL